MPRPAQFTNLKPSVRATLLELFGQLSVPLARRRALDEFLTEAETLLVSDGQDADAPGLEYDLSTKRLLLVLAEQRDWTVERAVLDLAFSIGLMSPGRHHTLRKAIGDPVDVLPDQQPKGKRHRTKPRWDRDGGALCFGDEIVRRVQIRQRPTRYERILSAFQERNWITAISEPFNGELRQSELHITINRLNAGLRNIRFRVRAGGKEIIWEVKGKSNASVIQ